MFEQAEKTAELYRMQQESEKVAREKAARTIVKVIFTLKFLVSVF